MSAAKPSTVTVPGRPIATVAPLSNPAHSSNVEASNTNGACSNKTSDCVIASSRRFRLNRTTAPSGTCTPFGVPVEPEVYIKYKPCEHTRAAAATGVASRSSKVRTSSALAPDKPSDNAPAHKTCSTSASSSIQRRRSGGYWLSNGT